MNTKTNRKNAKKKERSLAQKGRRKEVKILKAERKKKE